VPSQHNTDTGGEPLNSPSQLEPENLVVPLGLPGFHILSQAISQEGTLEVHLISTNERACCPHCGRVSPKRYDCRRRRKRDQPVLGRAVMLVLYKRRFWCVPCQRAFTETDTACGWRRRTTARFRAAIGQQACQRPIALVAQEAAVGPRFVQACLETVAEQRLAKQGRTLDETCPLPPPRLLGIDEFARRKGKRYDTI
jgi:transposase